MPGVVWTAPGDQRGANRILPWDERMRVGGKHGDWFPSMNEAGRKTVRSPTLDIASKA